MRNSNVLAIAPTATISNITATSPCIEPTYKNLFVKSNLSGEFIILNPYLVKDLKARSLWSQEMIDNLKYFDGELKDIPGIPEDLKQKYLTAFDIDFKWILDAAARRQKWIDQSQSVNLWLKTPDLKTLSHMYRAAWHQGLKTTYYLRTLGASNIEKATISVKKEVRGAVKEGQDGGINSGDTIAGLMAIAIGDADKPITLSGASAFHRSPEQVDSGLPVLGCLGDGGSPLASQPARTYTDAEKNACSIEAMRNGGTCEACQ
jgi:ribonucleoside-diphosphate reductase alpha chain